MPRNKIAEALPWVNKGQLKSLVDTVLDTIVDGVITINESSQIQSYNQACVDLFGYTCEEVRGKNVRILIVDPGGGESDNPLKEHYQSELTKIIGVHEVRGRRKDGSIFPMELSVGETNQGDGLAFVGIIRDISERLEAEKGRAQLRHAQKMEALGQLTGGIAHDFNNLLAVILGNLDFMVERTKDDDPLRTFLTPSIEAAEHGAELTKQLLAFGRKQSLQPHIVSLNELLRSFRTMMKNTLGERIKIILTLEDDLWNVSVDPSQLQNALLNLAVNARDAMPAGGKLTFQTENVTLDAGYVESTPFEVVQGEYVMMAIRDTGTGMTQAVMDKAFDPFFTTKEAGKGTGLGLSMVYGFVKQSKGHINLYSEAGQGTLIKIHLPRAQGTALHLEEEKEKSVCAEKKNIRVLVVEDNRGVLTLTSSMVESLGYRVLQAGTGDEGIKILQTNSGVELLLTDVMLPGVLNGPELAKHALALYPNLKVLFSSGYAEQAIQQNGLLEKGVNLIGKPFRKQQLADKIDAVLKQSAIPSPPL